MGDDLRCYLADFGLASISDTFSSTTAVSVHTRGSTRWMAPEAFMSTITEHDNHEHASAERRPRDVYAFGCTILEVCYALLVYLLPEFYSRYTPVNHHFLNIATIFGLQRK